MSKKSKESKYYWIFTGIVLAIILAIFIPIFILVGNPVVNSFVLIIVVIVVLYKMLKLRKKIEIELPQTKSKGLKGVIEVIKHISEHNRKVFEKEAELDLKRFSKFSMIIFLICIAITIFTFLLLFLMG